MAGRRNRSTPVNKTKWKYKLKCDFCSKSIANGDMIWSYQEHGKMVGRCKKHLKSGKKGKH